MAVQQLGQLSGGTAAVGSGACGPAGMDESCGTRVGQARASVMPQLKLRPMTIDEITRALRSSSSAPSETLRACVGKANELAHSVFAAAGKLCRGVYLLPDENALLFYGLYILAAAKHPDLFKHVLAIARLPEEDLDRLFPDHASTSLTRLLLSTWEGDTDALFEMSEHADLVPDAKWALFDVLARLTFDGRIPRERTLAFLERLERDHLVDDGDCVWWGWEEAVTKLGAKQLEPALRRVWSKVINKYNSEQERAESLEELNRAAANPTDPSIFDELDVRPIYDPAEAVAWVDQRAEALAKWRTERAMEGCPLIDDDPAKAIRLTDDERDWLAGFLVSRQAPNSAMTFEMLDGLLTALVIGPTTVMPSEYLPEIWGTDDGEGPVWESLEQAQYFMDLLMKHWNAIAARRNADAPHAPLIDHFGDAERGQRWAKGFVVGVDLGRASWESIFQDRRSAEIILSIFALVRDDPDIFEDRITPEMRAEILDQLPVIVQIIAAYWRDPGARPSRREPVRSTKVGRNEPCPCGSGKKFKKCRGSVAPTVH